MPADAPGYFGQFRIRVSPVMIRKKHSNIQRLLRICKLWMFYEMPQHSLRFSAESGAVVTTALAISWKRATASEGSNLHHNTPS